MRTASINLLWQPQAQFAGYLVAERLDLGRPWGVRIETSPLVFGIGPVRSVLGGGSLFGVASPAHLLKADPAALSLLLVMQQESALVYPVRKESGIERLADFAGRRISVWPGGEDLELRWMLHKAGLAPHAVERIPQVDPVTPFLAGETDSAQVTLYHELHLIEEAGLGPERLRLFRAADQGAALVKDGLMTSRRLVEQEPDFVQAVVNAVMAGWAHAFQHPEEAVAICCQARSALSPESQRRQLADIRALTFCGATRTKGLGFPDPLHVERAARALADLGTTPESLAFDDVIASDFWTAAPVSFKLRS
ncbi:MAG: ABC transporter substrate-binding protein [Kiloniellales bacterium]